MTKPPSDDYALGFACGRYTTIEKYLDWMTHEFFHGYLDGINLRTREETRAVAANESQR
jgi:hypothetical protein